jgi:hypothetical protein
VADRAAAVVELGRRVGLAHMAQVVDADAFGRAPVTALFEQGERRRDRLALDVAEVRSVDQSCDVDGDVVIRHRIVADGPGAGGLGHAWSSRAS